MPGSIVAGIRRNSNIHVPGFGFLPNHGRALKTQHLKALKEAGFKLEPDPIDDSPNEVTFAPTETPPHVDPDRAAAAGIGGAAA